MSKSPVLGFCDSEVMSDEKKLPHASDQGNVGLLVVIAHEVFVERSSVLLCWIQFIKAKYRTFLRRGSPDLERGRS